jgi:hypothetical protein
MSYTIHTDKSWQATMRELSDTMSKWGIKEWDTNYPKGARLEGMRQTEEDRTVHLTYHKDGRPVKLTMGKQARAVDNLRVLYLAVEAMRMNEKRGLGEVIQDAYLQLAGPEPTIDPYQLLGIRPDASIEFAEAAWKFMMKSAHPDAGGSEEQVKKLNAAIEQIRKERQV